MFTKNSKKYICFNFEKNNFFKLKIKKITQKTCEKIEQQNKNLEFGRDLSHLLKSHKLTQNYHVDVFPSS